MEEIMKSKDYKELKIVIHIDNDGNIEIFGINTYLHNYVDFIVLCTEISFELYELVDYESSYDLGIEEWYDDFF
jgi:hypothetical protein